MKWGGVALTHTHTVGEGTHKQIDEGAWRRGGGTTRSHTRIGATVVVTAALVLVVKDEGEEANCDERVCVSIISTKEDDVGQAGR